MFIEFKKLFWKRRKKFGGLKKLSKLFSIVIIQFWNLVYKCQKICFLKIKFYSAKMTRINFPLILLMSNSWTIWKCETTNFLEKCIFNKWFIFHLQESTQRVSFSIWQTWRPTFVTYKSIWPTWRRTRDALVRR